MTEIIIVASLLTGLLVGYVIRTQVAKQHTQSAENKASELVQRARRDSEEIVLKAKKEAVEVLNDAKKEELKLKENLTRLEERLVTKEERLEREHKSIEEKQTSLETKIKTVKELHSRVKELEAEASTKLEARAKMTRAEAREELIKQLESESKDDLLNRIKKLETASREELERKAAELVATTMQRVATNHIEEYTTSSVILPNEEVKGRIIGKEGRNIRAFQRATGVELIVDETPDSVIISSFSPLRRNIAKVSLERLIQDGRIQPARIEEIVQKVKEEFADKIRQLGEEAVYELGITDFDPKLVDLLGTLHFRTSYGQNVLRHSVEAAHIGSILATELKGDAGLVKRACLLHDVGKAVSHEVEGTHIEIGKRIMEKFKVDPRVIDATLAHHEDVPFTTLESRIVQIADAISASRPGARKESYEQYVKRLEELEAIATAFTTVKKAFAIQAGREIRIFVDPEQMDDFEAVKLAKDVARKIEHELTYPGEIKVHVIRETRVVEYAR